MSKTNYETAGVVKRSKQPLPGYSELNQHVLHSENTTCKYKSVRTTKAKAFKTNATRHADVLRLLRNNKSTSSDPDLLSEKKVFQSILPRAAYAAATAMTDGNIYFNFSDNSDEGTAAADDKIVLLAFTEMSQQIRFNLNAGTRSSCEAILETEGLRNCMAHTWIKFVSNDGKQLSTYVYTGLVCL